MAWQVVRWVCENGQAAGNSIAEQAVALVRAEHAHPDGTGSCPSIKTVAKAACMSERRAQLATRALEKRGFIEEQSGEGRYHARTYRFPGFMSWVNTSAPMPSLMGADSGDMGAENSVMGAGNDSSWVNTSAPEPCVNRFATEGEPGGEPARTRANGPPPTPKRTPIPDDFFLAEGLIAWTEAKAPGWGSDRIANEFEGFQDYYRKTGQTMASWPAAWRSWVRKAMEYDAERQARAQPAGGQGPKGIGDVQRNLARFARGEGMA